jgi:CheY-like chemotaxis protein/anti-sigma regulatory factor (Ser/Thr protein kinase)
MVNDLLDLAKVDAGKLEARMAPVEIEALFGVLRGMFRPLLTGPRPVALVFEYDGGPSALVSDEAKMSQILRNLISNAIKFTEQGEIRVRATLGERETAVFSVEDTGVGIARADLVRIFDEFSQVDQPLQRRSQGTGLGLPLSQKLAALLGGRIEVESEPGVGSTFRLVLPLRPQASVAQAVAVAEGPRVLVVDDEESGRAAVRRALAGIPVRLMEAGTASAALKLARSERPDVVVLDLGLPDFGGEEVLEALRSDAATREVPIVVFTSKQLRMTDRDRLQAADAIFSKREPDTALRAALESLWKGTEAER